VTSDHLFHHHQLGVEHDHRRDLPDAAGFDWRGGTFWLYTVLNVAFIGVTFWLIPETKGVTLEHIERKLMKGEKLRDIGV
jgi:hypothetical protein